MQKYLKTKNCIKTQKNEIQNIKFYYKKSTNYNFTSDFLKRLSKKILKLFYYSSKLIIIIYKKNFIKKIEIIHPGTINLKQIQFFKTKKNPNIYNYDKTVLDYGGANIAKNLHIGHIRCVLLGELIYNLKKDLIAKTISDIHIGDWGSQSGLLIFSITKKNKYIIKNFFLLNYFIHILSNNYKKIIKKKKISYQYYYNIDKKIVKLQKNYKNIKKLWLNIRQISIQILKKTYNKLNVFFNLWNSESSTQHLFQSNIYMLRINNIVKSHKKSLIILIPILIPILVLKYNGIVLYSTTDIITLEERKKKYLSTEIIYIVDNRQKLHFKQLVEYNKITKDNTIKIKHLNFGTINDSNKQPFKTRKGFSTNINLIIKLIILLLSVSKKIINKKVNIKLQQLITLSLLKFDILLYPYNTGYNLIYYKLKTYEGKTGIYLIYTLIRIKSLFKKLIISIKKLQPKKLTKFEKNIVIYSNNINNKNYNKNILNILNTHKLGLDGYEIAAALNKLYSKIFLKFQTNKKKIQYIFIYYNAYKAIKKLLKLIKIQIPIII